MGWGICHFHNNGIIIESFESKDAKQQAWLCFDMVHVIMWLLTMYALFSVIGCASITQAIFQCKKAAPFSWWTHINQQCTRRFKFVAVAVGGCIVWLQEQSNQFRLLIAMSTCDVDQAALATSAAQCVGIFGIMESVCLHLCSPLGVGFPPLLTFSLVATTGSPCMMIQQNGTLMLF